MKLQLWFRDDLCGWSCNNWLLHYLVCFEYWFCILWLSMQRISRLLKKIFGKLKSNGSQLGFCNFLWFFRIFCFNKIFKDNTWGAQFFRHLPPVWCVHGDVQLWKSFSLQKSSAPSCSSETINPISSHSVVQTRTAICHSTFTAVTAAAASASAAAVHSIIVIPPSVFSPPPPQNADFQILNWKTV